MNIRVTAYLSKLAKIHLGFIRISSRLTRKSGLIHPLNRSEKYCRGFWWSRLAPSLVHGMRKVLVAQTIPGTPLDEPACETAGKMKLTANITIPASRASHLIHFILNDWAPYG